VTSTCAWCGKPLSYAGTGRRPTYCSERRRLKAKRKRRGRFRAPKTLLPGAAEGVSGRTSPELRAALERVRLAERQLAKARAARAALDGPKPNPLDEPHTFTTYTGEEWLASRRGGGFNPGPGVAAMAENIERQHGTRD
jgi:DNA-directed RNA polymerase subunit RPC12/RpoP